MKRYWRLIAIVTVVVLTIGTFYIQSALAGRDLPDVTIETVNGDANEIDPVEVEGDYNAGGELMRVQIDKSGASYSGEQTLFQQLASGVYQERIQELQDEHRGFMRGKSGSSTSYLETENTLAYADIPNQTVSQDNEAAFDIAVLNKENDETTSFTLPVPDKDKYHYLFVEDVQMSGDELIVITRNSTRDSDGAYLYRIDLQEQTVNNVINLSEDYNSSDKGTANFNIQTSNDETVPRDDILFQKTLQTPISNGDQTKAQEQQFETQSDGYMAYNLKTGKMKELDSPEALPNQTTIGRDDTTLYFKNEKKMIAYHFKKNETRELALPASFVNPGGDEGTEPVIRIKDDKAYMLTRLEEWPQRLLVLDLTSGDTLYEARLMFDDRDDKTSVDLYNLTVD